MDLRKVKPLLVHKNMAQKELAARIQMDEGQLSRTLSNRQVASVRTLERLAVGLDIPLGKLIKIIQEDNTK